jgi:hypothetical protein
LRAQYGSTSFSEARNKLGRRNAEVSGQAKNLIGPYANCFVVAAPIAGLALIEKRTFAYESKLYFCERVLKYGSVSHLKETKSTVRFAFTFTYSLAFGLSIGLAFWSPLELSLALSLSESRG